MDSPTSLSRQNSQKGMKSNKSSDVGRSRAGTPPPNTSEVVSQPEFPNCQENPKLDNKLANASGRRYEKIANLSGEQPVGTPEIPNCQEKSKIARGREVALQIAGIELPENLNKWQVEIVDLLGGYEEFIKEYPHLAEWRRSNMTKLSQRLKEDIEAEAFYIRWLDKDDELSFLSRKNCIERQRICMKLREANRKKLPEKREHLEHLQGLLEDWATLFEERQALEYSLSYPFLLKNISDQQKNINQQQKLFTDLWKYQRSEEEQKEYENKINKLNENLQALKNSKKQWSKPAASEHQGKEKTPLLGTDDPPLPKAKQEVQILPWENRQRELAAIVNRVGSLNDWQKEQLKYLNTVIQQFGEFGPRLIQRQYITKLMQLIEEDTNARASYTKYSSQWSKGEEMQKDLLSMIGRNCTAREENCRDLADAYQRSIEKYPEEHPRERVFPKKYREYCEDLQDTLKEWQNLFDEQQTLSERESALVPILEAQQKELMKKKELLVELKNEDYYDEDNDPYEGVILGIIPFATIGNWDPLTPKKRLKLEDQLKSIDGQLKSLREKKQRFNREESKIPPPEALEKMDSQADNTVGKFDALLARMGDTTMLVLVDECRREIAAEKRSLQAESATTSEIANLSDEQRIGVPEVPNCQEIPTQNENVANASENRTEQEDLSPEQQEKYQQILADYPTVTGRELSPDELSTLNIRRINRVCKQVRSEIREIQAKYQNARTQLDERNRTIELLQRDPVMDQETTALLKKINEKSVLAQQQVIDLETELEAAKQRLQIGTQNGKNLVAQNPGQITQVLGGAAQWFFNQLKQPFTE